MIRIATLAVLATLVGATAAAAQDRAQLIEQARATSEESLRRNLFIAAADPTQPVDSLWAVSAYELAQIMRDIGADEAATAWIRWARRHGRWEIDRSYFAPSFVTFYDQAASEVGEDPDGDAGVAMTAWDWPSGFTGVAPGSLRVGASEEGVPLTVVLDGQETVTSDAPLPLDPRTYELMAFADGYDTLRIQREVLPGVETVVTFDLPPVMTPALAERVAGSVVSLRPVGGDATLCRSAFAAREGLVLTSLAALGGATQLEVFRPSTLAIDGEVIATDPARDLAVVSVPTLQAPALEVAALPAPGFAWAVFPTGCATDVAMVRHRLSDGGALAPVPEAAVGAPYVDRQGAARGLVAPGGRVSSLDGARELIDAAAEQLETGGFPVVWVAVGAATIGGAAALLLFGGGEEDTGSIVITVPTG